MAINNPPIVQFGLDTSMQNSTQLVLFNASVLDGAITATGSNASNGYPIRCGANLVVSAAAGTGLVLPATSSLINAGGFPAALNVWISVGNVANYPTVYPNPNDAGGTINGAASVVLGANTITPFQCLTPGLWNADSIGTGAAGSLETVVVQPTLAAAGNSQGTAAAITQAMVNVTSSAASQGVILPSASPGLQVVINDLSAVGNSPLLVYPQGTQTINGTAGPTGFSVTLPFTAPVIFFCFVAGQWVTK